MATKTKPAAPAAAGAIRAALKAQRRMAEDKAANDTWAARYDPAWARFDRHIERVTKRLRARGLAELRRKFGTQPFSHESTKRHRQALYRRFPDFNWLSAAIEVLGGPSAAAKTIGRNVRTIRMWLKQPVGRLSYVKFSPIGRALGFEPDLYLWCDLIMDQVQREAHRGEEAA